jgi:undecaprenyl pyrophosphate phosphatase UppP
MRNYLIAQGIVATLLALGLLFVPSLMSTIWPWAITPLLAQLYSAPFLAYGIGSLYAARQRTWDDVRIVVTTVLVFALGVLVASKLHANLFNPHGLAAWLWFGGFFLVSVTLALFWLKQLSSR